MNEDKAAKLIGKFWAEMPESEMLDESIYVLDYFITWIYEKGLEIAPKEFVGIKSNVVDK